MNNNTHTNAVDMTMPYYTTNLCPVPRFHLTIYAAAAFYRSRFSVQSQAGKSRTVTRTVRSADKGVRVLYTSDGLTPR